MRQERVHQLKEQYSSDIDITTMPEEAKDKLAIAVREAIELPKEPEDD
jgi:hypothetical protein